MEDKRVNLSEALQCVFKGNWKLKFFGVLLLMIPMFVFSFSIMLMQQKIPQPRDMMAFFIINTVLTLVSIILYGYFALYSHDRGLNKNAQLRNLGECLPDAFFVGLKMMIGYTINIFLVIIVAIVPFILIFLLNFIPILGSIAFLILAATFYILIINFMFKLYNHFLKDLKLISWFQWKLALRYNKDCHFGKLEMFLAILIVIGVSIIGIILSAIVYLPPLFTGNWVLLPILLLIFGPLMVLVGYFTMSFWANIFGQYTYNTLETKTGISPERIPNIINQDKVPALVIAGILFFLQLGFTLIAMNNPAMNSQMMNSSYPSNNMYRENKNSGSLNPMENLIGRQSDLAAIVKMKKSMSVYEDVAMIYMIEKDKTNVSEMFGSGCSNANEIFKNKIEREVSTCQFIMNDGTYWNLNSSTGEATVSDNYDNPNYTITFGICSDSRPNCQSEYPEAYKLIKGDYQ